MHKLLNLFLVLSLILIFGASATHAATLALSPASGSFAPGCTFQLTMTLDTAGAQVNGVDAVLLFDPNIVTVPPNPVQNGTLFPQYISVPDATNGKLAISGFSDPSSSYSGKGTFATASFQILNNASPAQFTINYQFDPNNPGLTTDSNVVEKSTVTELLSSVTNGTYSVSTTGGCKTTTTSTTSTTASGSAALTHPVGGVQPTTTTPSAALSTAGSYSPTLILSITALILIMAGSVGILALR